MKLDVYVPMDTKKCDFTAHYNVGLYLKKTAMKSTKHENIIVFGPLTLSIFVFSQQLNEPHITCAAVLFLRALVSPRGLKNEAYTCVACLFCFVA